ncbi:MAG: hypothetical protein CL521_03000 [Actinobacteria bacterium]|nr:hypothetical protein [Actinomycetota bacterium]
MAAPDTNSVQLPYGKKEERIVSRAFHQLENFYFTEHSVGDDKKTELLQTQLLNTLNDLNSTNNLKSSVKNTILNNTNEDNINDILEAIQSTDPERLAHIVDIDKAQAGTIIENTEIKKATENLTLSNKKEKYKAMAKHSLKINVAGTLLSPFIIPMSMYRLATSIKKDGLRNTINKTGQKFTNRTHADVVKFCEKTQKKADAIFLGIAVASFVIAPLGGAIASLGLAYTLAPLVTSFAVSIKKAHSEVKILYQDLKNTQTKHEINKGVENLEKEIETLDEEITELEANKTIKTPEEKKRLLTEKSDLKEKLSDVKKHLDAITHIELKDSETEDVHIIDIKEKEAENFLKEAENFLNNDNSPLSEPLKKKLTDLKDKGTPLLLTESEITKLDQLQTPLQPKVNDKISKAKTKFESKKTSKQKALTTHFTALKELAPPPLIEKTKEYKRRGGISEQSSDIKGNKLSDEVKKVLTEKELLTEKETNNPPKDKLAVIEKFLLETENGKTLANIKTSLLETVIEDNDLRAFIENTEEKLKNKDKPELNEIRETLIGEKNENNIREPAAQSISEAINFTDRQVLEQEQAREDEADALLKNEEKNLMTEMKNNAKRNLKTSMFLETANIAVSSALNTLIPLSPAIKTVVVVFTLKAMDAIVNKLKNHVSNNKKVRNLKIKVNYHTHHINKTRNQRDNAFQIKELKIMSATDEAIKKQCATSQATTVFYQVEGPPAPIFLPSTTMASRRQKPL